jgi:hypothetical protein
VTDGFGPWFIPGSMLVRLMYDFVDQLLKTAAEPPPGDPGYKLSKNQGEVHRTIMSSISHIRNCPSSGVLGKEEVSVLSAV